MKKQYARGLQSNHDGTLGEDRGCMFLSTHSLHNKVWVAGDTPCDGHLDFNQRSFGTKALTPPR
jgi:hypothetical protein